MPEFTLEAMAARRDELHKQVTEMTEALVPLHDKYDRMRVQVDQANAKMQTVADEIAEQEKPLRTLRVELAMLARALGGLTLAASEGPKTA